MVYSITISVLCAVIAGIARAVSNKVLFHYDHSVFKNKAWFNPKTSWRNKYKKGNPLLGEKFKGSTTIFVLFTDAFHLFEFVFRITFATSFIFATLLLTNSLWFAFGYIVIYLVFAGVFHLFFTFIFNRQTLSVKTRQT